MLEYAADYGEQDIPRQRVHRFFPILANVTFILYLFASFFGTGIPFREKITEVSEIGTSYIVNQIVFSALFVFAVIALIPVIKTAVSILYKEKIFTFFILWGLLSIVWSDYSFVSFKRWFQYFTNFTVALSVMSHVEFSEVLLKRIKYLFYLYIIVSFASIIMVPGATDIYGIWRGIAPSKNHLGQAALMSCLVIFYSVSTDHGFKRIISIGMFLLAVLLLVGSQSMTSLTSFVFVVLLSVVFYLDKFFNSVAIGRFVTVVIIVSMGTLFLTVVVLAPDLIAALAGSAGRDLTFTGRTDLWRDILLRTQEHWVLGAGFQGFWVLDNPSLMALYDTYSWLPNQAHNGYLDILNEMGVIGLLIFFLMIANYFRSFIKLKLPHYWKWFVIAAILVNFQESAFIRPQVVSGVMFMFSYMALFSDKYRKDKIIIDEQIEQENEQVHFS